MTRPTLRVAAAAVLLPLALLHGCGPDPSPLDRGATIGEIQRRPARYLGRTVELRGPVHSVLAPGTFVLSGGSGAGDLLVVARDPAPVTIPPLRPMDYVEVAGELRRFEAAALAKELNRELPAESFAKWENRPALLADRVEKLR